jgi:putative ATP-dependent endonuclease of the OLD family
MMQARATSFVYSEIRLSGKNEVFFPESDVSVKEDFTKWKEKEVAANSRFIQIDFVLEINRKDDEGLHRFLQDYLALPDELTTKELLELTLSIRLVAEEKIEQIGLSLDGKPHEVLKAQEVYKRLRSSLVMLFHDSTEFFHPYRFRESSDLFRQMSTTDAAKVKTAQDNVNKILTKIAKKNQQDLTEMLGRLKDKYRIGLSIVSTDVEEVPYTITLGNEDGDVELENWGSGTQNRTRILMTLFKAKQVRDADTSSEKVTPIIIIEEPESYLHPSAQAEFGRTLRDLAEEFKIQVIVTTHSPYLLSLEQADANILLNRKVVRKRSRDTEVVNTAGDKWVEPFCLALGISDAELAPWKEALFSNKDAVLLVEGDIDKEYLELLKDEAHGEDRLKFTGTIFSYGGKDTLKQKQLLRFIMSQFKQFLITYDLDCENEIEPTLKALGLVKNIDYLAVGRDLSGKRAIEGMLPDEVLQAVFSNNVDLVQKATSATGSEAKSAKSSLKKLYLDEFKKKSKPKSDSFKSFYGLTRQINKMLKGN